MYIYGNNSGCSVNNECESGYSLYFPCVKTLTRGENSCFDFYIVDNATKKEIDLREVDDITLNMSGIYNCNFGSYSYPEYIEYLQVEKFSDIIYEFDFSDIINNVKLYIDIVDENHNLIESYLFDKNLKLDIAIEGNIGYFLNEHSEHNILNLKGYDTYSYMFLGWNIDEDDEDCNLENIYDYLIKDNNLVYTISGDCNIRIVYQKRREYIIQMADDNYNSSFVIDYMGKHNVIKENDSLTVLEGHDIKISCIPNFNEVESYVFNKWDDGYKNPYRVLSINGDDLIISLKAHCSLQNNNIKYVDNIDASALNKFNTIYPDIKNNIFVDSYYVDNIYINNCEFCVLDDIPYVKMINNGYIQILNIKNKGIFKLSLNNIGVDSSLFIDNNEVLSVNNNEFIFEFNGEIITLTGEDSYICGLKLSKEVIYNKGKCMFCLSSEDTLKLYTGELVVDGGIIINGNPYGISSVKFAKVTNITPLIIK